MQAPLRYQLLDNSLWLSVERCIYWENENALILSDLHFGKTGHFRKFGIAVPQNVYKEDLQRLLYQVQFFNARKIIVVGDLFHSNANKEHDLFKKWRNDINGVEVHLIKGNHDLLNEAMYGELNIQVHHESLNVGKLNFIHDVMNPLTSLSLQPGISTTSHFTFAYSKATPRSHNTLHHSARTYSISGHIHPGIRVGGIAKQALSFPCFYFGEQYAVLPAFSRFTGFALIDPKQHENVFAIVENKLLQIQ
jgi:DNA ligase-associated metallophosphoesterase